MAKRVLRAREMQRERFGHASLNAAMTSGDIGKYCDVSEKVHGILERAVEKYALSARGYANLLKVSRTIADLEQCERISEAHLMEALGYRRI